MPQRFDVAVVGAGIVGLAHAHALARQGRRVVVRERHLQAQGASVRNFGMLWPIGQPAGPRYRLARRSLDVWLDVLQASGLWHERTGSLHLSYAEDEGQVLREFVADARHEERGCRLLSAGEVVARFPAVQPRGLQAGLWSPVETCVDPRAVIAGLPDWLRQTHGVHFALGCQVIGYERPVVRTAAGAWEAEQLLVCTGDDFQGLYPALFAGSGLVRCKLQMLRSHPAAGGWRLGPMLAAGLTLRHYPAFAACPSLPELVRRLDAELPAYGRYGIHVLATQNGDGELVLGDSHEYGNVPEPFDKQEIDDLILGYLARFLAAPGLRVAQRWHGTYARHPSEPYFVARPAEGVTVVTGLGGAGMTLSFGLAEQVAAQLERPHGD
jgi:D-hydroxyproline dehydrogenase subunit beta